MLKQKFLRSGSKGIEYNEKFFGTKSSFSSYISGYEKSILVDATSQTDSCVLEDKYQFEDLEQLQLPQESIKRIQNARTQEEINEDSPLVNETEINLEKTAVYKCNLEKFNKIIKNKHTLVNDDRKNLAEVKPTKIKETPSVLATSSDNNINNGNVLRTLQTLREGNNLEKFLEANGLSTSGSGAAITQLKQAFERFLSKNSDYKQKEISKYEQQLASLQELTDDKKLEKWLESKGVPSDSVSLPKIKAELQRYFRPQKENKNNFRNNLGTIYKTAAEPHWGKVKNRKIMKESISDTEDDESNSIIRKTPSITMTMSKSNADISSKKVSLNNQKVHICDPSVKRTPRDFGVCQPIENFSGRSLVYHENTLAKKLWDDFMNMSAAKQVAVIVGITVVTAALGFVSWRILLMAFPTMFSSNQYWGEVLAQWFIQRQESTFHLFQHTAENAKPLSTTWANQYILWKYI